MSGVISHLPWLFFAATFQADCLIRQASGAHHAQAKQAAMKHQAENDAIDTVIRTYCI